MNSTSAYKCKHCETDPHSPTISDAVIQLRGVWLCGTHYEQSVMLNGHLFTPEGARKWRRFVCEMERKGVAVAR